MRCVHGVMTADAEKVLRYDISAIPDENAEASEAYRLQTIEAMSWGDMIRCILLQPTVKLSRTDNNTGYEAQYIQNPLMNLYFTRDQSITTPRGHVIRQSPACSGRQKITRIFAYVQKCSTFAAAKIKNLQEYLN